MKRKTTCRVEKKKVMQTYKLSKITIRNYHYTAAASGLFWTLAKGWVGLRPIGLALCSCMPWSVYFLAIIACATAKYLHWFYLNPVSFNWTSYWCQTRGVFKEGRGIVPRPPLWVAMIAKLHRKVSKIKAWPPPLRVEHKVWSHKGYLLCVSSRL